MTVLQLTDDQAAALRHKAAQQGLSLEDWLLSLAGAEAPEEPPGRHIAEIICGGAAEVPDDVMAVMPEDGASQHDHYIYGWPKRRE